PKHAAESFAGWPLERLKSAVEACGGAARFAHEGACEGLNPHRTASDSPAASFNQRLSEILPGPGEDFGEGCVGRTSDTRFMVRRRNYQRWTPSRCPRKGTGASSRSGADCQS